jgi:multiple sugar transport system permease protein
VRATTVKSTGYAERGVIPKLFRFLKTKSLPYLLVAPMVLMVFVVIILPIIRTVWMSFFDWYLARPDVHPFVGLKNYVTLLKDPVFLKSVNVTTIYVVITVLVRFIAGMGIALLLNFTFKGRGIARSLLIIPWAVPEVVAALIWIQMLDYQYGIINYWAMNLGIIDEPMKWLASTSLALPAAMIVNIWKGTPWAAIMLLAGLQSIPQSLYEAAEIDGASLWNKFWHVTVPLLKPISLTVFLLLVIWTMKDFAIVYVLNKGGPANATQVLTIFIYQKAFQGLRMGVASAAGVMLLVASMVFTVVYLKVLEKEESVW